MPATLKKLIATIGILLLVIVYGQLAMEVGAYVAASHGRVVQLVYFVVAGFGWVPFAALLIWWAWRPQKPTGA